MIARLFELYRLLGQIPTGWVVVLANLVPVAGVLWFGWSVLAILVLYWIENGVVGVINVLKINRAEGPIPAGVTITGPGAGSGAKAFLIPFFCLHYGIFWVVHGLFVFLLPLFASFGSLAERATSIDPNQFIGRDGSVDPGALLGPSGLLAPKTGGALGTLPPTNQLLLAAGALFLSHMLSYWFNFIGRGEYKRVSPAVQMFAPYGRLVVLHLTIIFGGIFVSFLGAPIGLLLVLVAGKTVLDLAFHLREHDPRRLPSTV